MPGWDEVQAGIKIAWGNTSNLRYADDIPLMTESQEELKSLLMKVKEESEKAGLKLNFQKTKMMASGSITSWQIDGETVETVADSILGGSKITADGDCSHEIKRCLLFGKKSYKQPRQHIKKQRHYFVNKGPPSQGYGFSSGHVWMWELDYKESQALKNWCLWTVVLEKTLESPLDCKEFQPVHPKENQSWVFIGRTDVEAETPVVWPPDVKNWLIWKDADAGKDWRQKKGTTEDEMVGWHQWLNGHEFGWTLGAGDGQEDLACVAHGVAKSRTRLSNWTELKKYRTQDPSWRRQRHPIPVLRKSHGRRSLVGCSPWGLEELHTTKRLHFHFSLSCVGRGNGNPLQCSCLENPRDGGAWWAAVDGVTQSDRTEAT